MPDFGGPEARRTRLSRNLQIAASNMRCSRRDSEETRKMTWHRSILQPLLSQVRQGAIRWHRREDSLQVGRHDSLWRRRDGAFHRRLRHGAFDRLSGSGEVLSINATGQWWPRRCGRPGSESEFGIETRSSTFNHKAFGVRRSCGRRETKAISPWGTPVRGMGNLVARPSSPREWSRATLSNSQMGNRNRFGTSALLELMKYIGLTGEHIRNGRRTPRQSAPVGP